MYAIYWRSEFDDGVEDDIDDEVEAYCDARNRYRSIRNRIKAKRKYFGEEAGEDRRAIYD